MNIVKPMFVVVQDSLCQKPSFILMTIVSVRRFDTPLTIGAYTRVIHRPYTWEISFSSCVLRINLESLL